MAERLQPFPIRIRDAFFAELEKIGIDDETKWHTAPKTKALHNGLAVLDMADAPKPAIFLRTGTKTPEPWTNNTHKDTLEIVVYCANEDPRDPEAALWDLMADVERCFRENYSSLDVLSTGYLLDVTSEPHMEEVAGKAGIGFGLVRGHAYYQSDDINT